MSAQLTYYIFEGVLTGLAGGKTFHLIAFSGGRGGSTIKNVSTDAANNPYMTGLRTGYHHVGGKWGHGDRDVHGGPLPTGRYNVGTPKLQKVGKHLILAAKLSATRAAPGARDGFFIHGPGPHGSDGCIVPASLSQFHELMNALKRDSGGSLFVEQAMGRSGFA
jgi:hypothetical protein